MSHPFQFAATSLLLTLHASLLSAGEQCQLYEPSAGVQVQSAEAQTVTHVRQAGHA